ncbi:MAG: helix-hairpin-helix domain-containing protein [Burkholderiales bacterium]
MKKSALGLITLLALSSLAFAKTNVNTAPESELEALKDIGPVKAKSIIEYRQKHGAFKSLKDLEKVPGIAASTVAKIKDQVTVDGASTRAKPANSAASSKHEVPRN